MILQNLGKVIFGGVSMVKPCQFLLKKILILFKNIDHIRGGSRTAATSKTELFVIIVNGLKPLTIIRKSSILDVAAVLDPPLHIILRNKTNFPYCYKPSTPNSD